MVNVEFLEKGFMSFFSTFFSIFLFYSLFGDNMKKNFIFYAFLALLLGFVSAEVIYNDYKKNLDETKYNAYLVQIGSFDELDYEVNSDNYLVLNEDGVYNVYAGITTKLSNATKIKDLYESENIKSYIKPTIIDNVEFISNLKQFDILLEEVENNDNLISINDVIISRYEELILGK